MSGIPRSRRDSPHVLVDARFAARKRGGDRCRYELARYLVREAAGQYTFLCYKETEGLLRGQTGARTVTTPFAPSDHPGYDLLEHVGLPLLGRRIDSDIYHGTFNVIPLVPAARATVVTVHDLAVFAFPQAYGKRFAPYMRALISAGIRRAARIITVSDATKGEIARYFPGLEHKTVTILNGVGDEFIAAATLPLTEVTSVARRLRITTPYVLFVGNLEPKKNLARLIQAFQALRSSTDLPHTLVVVGERPTGLDSGLYTGQQSGEQHVVHFTGYVDDGSLPALYRGAALVAYPSLYEGFGMPVLEGMAVGTPVLTSSVSSLPEVAGGAAMLVDPLSVDDIAAGLYRALTDQAWRETAVRVGRARAAALSWEANARRTVALYHELWGEMGARKTAAKG